VAKLGNIGGLYVDPSAHAIVLSVDEKSQIQALDRTQPGLPLKPGRCGTMTTTISATARPRSSPLSTCLTASCMQRHRHQEFIRLLNTIEAETRDGKIVHVILDNYGSHKHPKVRAWLDRHPRSVFHYTPKSASWLNAVEGFFAKLTRRRLKRGVFCSSVDLQAAIKRFLCRDQLQPHALRLDRRSRYHHCPCQTWVPSVRSDLLETVRRPACVYQAVQRSDAGDLEDRNGYPPGLSSVPFEAADFVAQ
jgi:transposase